MDDVDSDDHDQEVIIIPIKDKTRDSSPNLGYRTDNGITVIKFDKSNNGNVVCEICSSTLKSMKYLERHMKSILSQTCFHCSECGVSKATRQQLQSHKSSKLMSVLIVAKF